MRMLPVGLVVIALLTIAFVGSKVRSSADDRVQTIPDIVVDSDSPRVLPTLMMQAKLAETQDVLDGLLNHDFGTIKTSAESLAKLAEMAPFRRDEMAEDRVYEHFRTEFVRLANQLDTMAEQRNLQGAAYVHQNLTGTCIACHSHLRDKVAD